MKKEYQKPVLFAESFEVCEHIAKHCGYEAGWSTHWDDNGGCGFRIEGPDSDQVLFYGTDPCNIDANDFEEGFIPEDLLPYHGGSLLLTDLFSS